MKRIAEHTSGSKTYAVCMALIAYLVGSHFFGSEIQQEVVYGLMGAAGITMRAAVKKAES